MNRLILCLFLIAVIGCHRLDPLEKGIQYQWYYLKKFENSFSYIPTTTINNLQQKSFEDSGSSKSTKYIYISFPQSEITVDSFYMFQFEVTNLGYREFLKDIHEKDTSLYKEMLPDQSVWRSKFFYYEPFVEYYFYSPNYNYYPVVGVSYNQATEYCKWLTEDYKLNKNRKYKDVVFKLPTKAQWFVAAMGKSDSRIFPWDGRTLQNESGQYLANFYKVNQMQIRRDSNFFEIGQTTRYYDNCLSIAADSNIFNKNQGVAHVRSYPPNDYNLYNMVGNVSELVREVGVTKGGSWLDPGHYLLLNTEQNYSTKNWCECNLGFRIVMEFNQKDK